MAPHAAIPTSEFLIPDAEFPARPPSRPGAGYVRAVATTAGGTSISHVRAESPLRLFTPRVSPMAAWVVTATLGGGLVGGDDIRLSVDVEDDARVLLTTQASTKVYRSALGARQHLDAHVADGALLVAWPDPIVGFAGSTFDQRQRFHLAEHATLLAVDWVVSGRRAYGEHWAFDRYVSRFEVERAGRAVFYDHLRLSQTDGPVAERMRGFSAYAVAVVTGPMVGALADEILADVSGRPADRRHDPIVSAAPLARTGGVVLRMAGTSVERLGATLREILRPIVPLVGDDPWARRW